MFYCEKLLRELHRAKIPYLVVGGMAVNLHGYDRSTGDLDIMVSLKTADVTRLVKVIKMIGFRPRLPVSLDDEALQAIARIRRNDPLRTDTTFVMKDPSEGTVGQY